MKGFDLESLRYRPGYCDMLGGVHSTALEKNKSGEWTIICRESNDHMSPIIVTTYEVAPEAVAEFEEFLLKNKVVQLEKRPKSDMFVTDYSPWSWRIYYSKTSFGKTTGKSAEISEYRKYSKEDHELLNELQKRLFALRGRKISEISEED